MHPTNFADFVTPRSMSYCVTSLWSWRDWPIDLCRISQDTKSV